MKIFSQLIAKVMIYKGVCKTALATPGLLINVNKINFAKVDKELGFGGKTLIPFLLLLIKCFFF